MYIHANLNPAHKSTTDCVIRAISLILDQSWRETMLELTAYSYFLYEIVDSNTVWERYLTDMGFRRINLPNTCPECYTLRHFCDLHPYGDYIVCTGSHVIAVIDGDYYDAWDSGNETVSYYFRKGV